MKFELRLWPPSLTVELDSPAPKPSASPSKVLPAIPANVDTEFTDITEALSDSVVVAFTERETEGPMPEVDYFGTFNPDHAVAIALRGLVTMVLDQIGYFDDWDDGDDDDDEGGEDEPEGGGGGGDGTLKKDVDVSR